MHINITLFFNFQYDDIPSLTSIRSYNKLDNDLISKGDYNECSRFNKESGEYSEPHLLCLSLTGNLKNYENLEFFEELNLHKCSYLNLWAHYRLSKLQGEQYSKMSEFIIKHWCESETYYTCNSTEFVLYLGNTEHYIKAKRIYDYALNYYKLKKYDENDVPCTAKEKEYIRKSLELYNDIKEECEDNQHEYKAYCKAYKKIKQIHPNNILLNLQCKKVEAENRPSGEAGKGQDQFGLLQQQQQTFGSQGGRRGDSLQTEPPHGPSADLLLPEVGYSSSSHKAMATTVPILAISSIFLLLYKVFINKI